MTLLGLRAGAAVSVLCLLPSLTLMDMTKEQSGDDDVVVTNSYGSDEVGITNPRLPARTSDHGEKPVKDIVFAGERFEVMSLRRWREKILRA